jgi:alkanesulfonate monooxygenase SsuD/methylene tetrahydromethanopterin reductase-like flavin-dependent oxidoreductase (luciferase family)
MRVGVFYFPTDYGIHPGELARELEARGFESLFVCEHTHIPVSRRTPFFGGGDLPKRYAHTHDPFVALSFAAAATHKLVLGTGVCLVVEHDPIVTAKSVHTRRHLMAATTYRAVRSEAFCVWREEMCARYAACYA